MAACHFLTLQPYEWEEDLRDDQRISASVPGEPPRLLPDQRPRLLRHGVSARRRPHDPHPQQRLHRGPDQVCLSSSCWGLSTHSSQGLLSEFCILIWAFSIVTASISGIPSWSGEQCFVFFVFFNWKWLVCLNKLFLDLHLLQEKMRKYGQKMFSRLPLSYRYLCGAVSVISTIIPNLLLCFCAGFIQHVSCWV